MSVTAAGAFGAKFAAQALFSGQADGIARTEATGRGAESPTLAELRAAAEEGQVKEESSDSDLEREREAAAEAAAAAAAEAALEEQRASDARQAAEALEAAKAAAKAAERERRAREKAERAVRRAEEKAAREAARRKAYEDWAEGDEPVTFDDGSCYTGKWRARRQDSDWEHGAPRVICRHGHGTYRFPDGSTYEGDWEHDVMHGQGIGVRESGGT